MEKTVQWALELRAHREGGSISAVNQALLRQALTPELEELAGTVPLAAMIQTVIHRQAHAARPAPGRPRATECPTVTPRP
jgi:hypothetical protein